MKNQFHLKTKIIITTQTDTDLKTIKTTTTTTTNKAHGILINSFINERKKQTKRNHLLQKITVRRRTIVKKPKSKSYFKLATTNKKSKIKVNN